MPQLSVIMSAYKCGNTVGEAVRSTLRAMPSDSELVVAVDGHDEPTEAALAAIVDPRLDVRVSEQNLGLAQQLVDLTARTDSRYLARMDSDDICLPWRFRVSMPALATDDFVFTSSFRFGEGRPTRPSYPLPLDAWETGVALMFFNPLFHPTMICRRESLERVGGYAVIPYGEDNELWLRAAAHGCRLRKLATPTLLYRLSPTQMSAGDGVDQRLLAEPRFREARLGLAQLLKLDRKLDTDQRLVLNRADVNRLVGPARAANRPYLVRQMENSSLAVVQD